MFNWIYMKSGKFDMPIDFNPIFNIDNYHIEYVNFMEVVQGGPKVGDLIGNTDLLKWYDQPRHPE